MSVPARRKTSSTRKARVSKFKIKKAVLSVCSSCRSPKRPHFACPSCGRVRTKK